MRQGKYLIIAGFAVGVAVALGTSMSAASASRRNGESGVPAVKAVIDALDRCVQDRFVRVDTGFGMSRMSMAMHNIHLFIPVNDTEREVVRELDAMRARVVMYLASWQQPRLGPQGYGAVPSLIQGPVLVHPTPQVVRMSYTGAPSAVHVDPRLLKDLPNETDLRAEASASLTALGNSDSREFDVDRWKFVARPVRASAEACVWCHNPRSREKPLTVPAVTDAGTLDNLRAIVTAPEMPDTTGKVFQLGDPLGAVLYGYQASPQQR